MHISYKPLKLVDYTLSNCLNVNKTNPISLDHKQLKTLLIGTSKANPKLLQTYDKPIHESLYFYSFFYSKHQKTHKYYTHSDLNIKGTALRVLQHHD